MGSIKGSRLLSIMVLMLLVILFGVKPSFASKAELVAALDNLPEKAPFALVVPNMKSFSDKVANLAKALGVPSGEMNNLLATMKDETGFASGLREDGALILTLADTSWFEKQAEALKNQQQPSHDEPPMIGLVPVTDADAFMKNMTNLRTEDGLTIGADKDGDDHYMKAVGKFVAIADDKAALQSFTAANQGAMWLKDAGDISQKTFEQADIVVLADMRKLAPSLLPMIEQGMKEFSKMQNDMAGQPGMAGGPDMAMVQTIMSMYAQAGTTLVRDTHVVMLAGNLSDKGLGLSMGAQFKPDSFLGKALKNGSPAAGLLAKVVNQNYLVAGAMNAQGIDLKALLGEVQKQLDAVSKDAKGGQMDWVVTLIKDMIPVYQNMRGMAQVMYIPAQVQMGMPMFNVVTLVDSADAPGFVEGMKKIMASMNNLKLPAAPGMGDEQGSISYTTSYTANAMQIEGVSVDQFTWQMQMPPELMQNNPAMPFMMMMGATGQTGYIARVGDHVVSTSSTDAQLLGATIKMLKAGNGLGSDKLIVDARNNALPEKPMAESYVSFGGIASLANMFIPMMGVPPIQVPADLPPVSMGVSLQDSAMVGTTHVPMSVMTFVRDTVQKLQAGPPQQQQQQGGGSAPRRRQSPDNAPAF